MSVRKLDPIIEILKKELDSKKERNGLYSLRSFSRFLGIDPSNLSKIMSYQLIPGEKLRNKIANKLGINSDDFIKLLSYQKIEDSLYQDHTLDIFNIISDWHHYALLELIKLDQYKNLNVAKEAMALTLGITLTELEDAVHRMVSVGLLKVHIPSGAIENTEQSSSSVFHASTSKAHKNHQKQILEKAIDALDKIPITERSQTSMTVAIDKEKLPQAQEMIKDFRRKLSRFLSHSENLDDVYHLSISLYPVTHQYKSKEIRS